MPELVETLPVEVETPPVEVVELEVMPPVVVVLVRPPVELEVEPPEVEEDEPPLELEVEVEPPEVVVETTTLPPELLPPPKKPPKKPPPKPKPPEPPITVTSPPPPCGVGIGGSGGSGIGIIASCCWAGAAQVTDLVTTRRIFFIGRGAGVVRAILRFIAFGFAAGLACLTYWTWAAGASATCTAPPPTTAPPAATADNFTRAIRTDISSAFFAFGWGWKTGSNAAEMPL